MKEQFLKEIKTIVNNCLAGKLDYNFKSSIFCKILRIEYAVDEFVTIELTPIPRKDDPELEVSGKYATHMSIKLNDEELTEMSYLFNLLQKDSSKLLLNELININNDPNL